MMGIDTLMSLVFENLNLYEQLLFILIFLTITFSSFIFFQNNTFLKKLKFYCIVYWIGIITFLVIIIFKILVMRFDFFSNIFLYICFYLIYFLSFIFSTVIPLIKYGKGLQIFIEKEIVVPSTGERIEIRLKNKTQLDEEITITLNLPENITFKDNSRSIEKTIRLKGYSGISVFKNIFPLRNGLAKIAFINVNSQIFGEIRKKVLFRT